MTSQSESVLLRGGPSDGSLISGVGVEVARLEVGGAVYVRSGDQGARASDPEDPRSTGIWGTRTYPVFEVLPSA